jgi:hypothetical protein
VQLRRCLVLDVGQRRKIAAELGSKIGQRRFALCRLHGIARKLRDVAASKVRQAHVVQATGFGPPDCGNADNCVITASPRKLKEYAAMLWEQRDLNSGN